MKDLTIPFPDDPKTALLIIADHIDKMQTSTEHIVPPTTDKREPGVGCVQNHTWIHGLMGCAHEARRIAKLLDVPASASSVDNKKHHINGNGQQCSNSQEFSHLVGKSYLYRRAGDREKSESKIVSVRTVAEFGKKEIVMVLANGDELVNPYPSGLRD